MSYDSVRESLPIYEYREELIEAIKENNLLVIIGETGSGKTTQIPQYVLEGLPDIKRTAITQPRRIAAITVAKRVAQEHGSRLGKTIGYTIRFEDCTSPETRLRYMTDGVLLREACGDPELKNYDMIIIDEAHERTVETDVLFGLLKKTHRLRPELKIIVMSATLNVEKFSDFFDHCPIFSIPGRTYDVDILHHHESKMASLKSTYLSRAVDTALHIHEKEPPGDILVFLTGQGEIEKACKDFKEKAREIDPRDIEYGDEIRRLEVYPIYSSLETFEQKAVFDRTPKGVRKVIFATNIAQTSVTIPGIRYVVDSGFVKQKSYDSQTGMDALLVVPVSQATATQRAGRAGRTQEGKAYRLYSRSAFEKLEADTVPEIQRSSLISTILGLKKIGIKNVIDFEYVDPPDSSLVRNALRQLYYLGAIDEYGRLTPLGSEMNSFPLSPFLSRALIASAREFKCSKEMIIIASMLSVEEVFLSPRGEKKISEAEEARKQFSHRTGDHLTLYNVYRAWRETGYSKSWCHDNYLRYRSLSMARNIREQLIQLMEKNDLPIISCKSSNDKIEPALLLQSIATAFYVNTAKRHPHRPIFYHYMSSTSNSSVDSNSSLLALHINNSSSLFVDTNSSVLQFSHIEWVMYHDIVYTNKATMRNVSKIEFTWVRELLKRYEALDEDKLILGEVIDTKRSSGKEESPISKNENASTDLSAKKAPSIINDTLESNVDDNDKKRKREEAVLAAKQRFLARKSYYQQK